MKIILLADGMVGFEICSWILEQHRQDIGLAVTTGDNKIKCAFEAAGVPCVVYASDQALLDYIQQSGQIFDWGFLAWWPFIVNAALIAVPKHGFVNTHPSLLPFNRGKHYNFWALVEEAPFGVSLHMVEDGIDCGDIVAQKPISYGWEDNGGTLYEKACNAMIELFTNTYPKIRVGRVSYKPQNLKQGSFHFASELDPASIIDLEAQYCARDLLNLLRARTFPGHPACSFTDRDGAAYEVRIEIRRKQK